jgi:hypothetical protein
MPYFNGKKINDADFCKCTHCSAITSQMEEFGYWDVCCDCGKPLEDGFHYFNHYDGEDHDDIDLY